MLWFRYVIATLLAITPMLAAAEPVTVMIGPEIRTHLTGPTEYGGILDPRIKDGAVSGLFASVAYPLSPDIALGIHAGMASRHSGTTEGGMGLMASHDNLEIIVDVAATMQFTSGRLWIAPWLGRHVTRRRTDTHVCVRNSIFDPSTGEQCNDSRTVEWTDDFTSLGVTAGIDLVRIGAHNVAVFVDAQTGFGSYAAISAGVGYRLDFGAAATRSANH